MRRLTTTSGFTLAELLTVIAMIALMTALLFPVLHKGKLNAQAAYDLNNQRQILIATQMYAGDTDDYLPQPGWGTEIACWAAGAHIPLGGLPATFERYTNTLPEQLDSFSKGQLYSYLKNPKLLKCPADNILNRAFIARNIYISSYVWNAAILGFPPRSILGRFPETFRLRQFKPEALLIWEADETRPYCFNDFANYPDEGISGRHANGPTVGRFDGGAERMPMSLFVDQSGEIAGSLAGSGMGWRRSRVPAPNALWCSPVHNGVPETTPAPTGP